MCEKEVRVGVKFLFDGGVGMQSMKICRGATELIKILPYKKSLLIEIFQNSYKKPSIQKALTVNSCYLDDTGTCLIVSVHFLRFSSPSTHHV
jgi:hypothetical protein